MGPGHRLGLVVGDGPGVTIRTTADAVAVDAGTDEARVVVALDDEAFAALRSEDLSVFGLLYAGLLRIERGEFGQFAAWEPALQALLYDRPVYDHEAAAAFVGDDLARSFAVDGDPAEMGAFLDRAGFLHVRGVFGADEVPACPTRWSGCGPRPPSTTAGRGGPPAPTAATSAAGSRSWGSGRPSSPAWPTTGACSALADLTGLRLLPAPTRNDGISVVIKNPGVTAGLSDLPWHRDCGLGGHDLLCPGLNVGIQLDRADAANGQLWFLPGSHRHGGPLGDPWADGYPTVAIDADPGDVTVHFGHVLHAAPPPSAPDAGRRAIYLGFSKPELFAVIPEGKAYNDVIYADGRRADPQRGGAGTGLIGPCRRRASADDDGAPGSSASSAGPGEERRVVAGQGVHRGADAGGDGPLGVGQQDRVVVADDVGRGLSCHAARSTRSAPPVLPGRSRAAKAAAVSGSTSGKKISGARAGSTSGRPLAARRKALMKSSPISTSVPVAFWPSSGAMAVRYTSRSTAGWLPATVMGAPP